MRIDDGVKTRIVANVGSVEANLRTQIKNVTAGIAGRLVPSSKYIPLRLGDLKKTDGFLQGGMTYVDDGKTAYRLSLASIKDMNTKIVTVDDINDVDFDKLSAGDYVYIKK